VNLKCTHASGSGHGPLTRSHESAPRRRARRARGGGSPGAPGSRGRCLKLPRQQYGEGVTRRPSGLAQADPYQFEPSNHFFLMRSFADAGP
jgi:hypothetical protein